MVVPENTLDTNGQIRESTCDLDQSAYALNALPKATVFAPVDIGPSLLDRTPDSVVATGHHRGQAGMRDVIQAFIGPEAQAHAIIRRHNARYVVLCTDLGEPKLYAAKAPQGFMAQMLAGKVPGWLRDVPLKGVPSTFRVWQVVG